MVCKLRLNSEKYVKGHVQLWWWPGNVSDSFCYFRTHERHAVGRVGFSLFVVRWQACGEFVWVDISSLSCRPVDGILSLSRAWYLLPLWFIAC